MTFSLPHVSLGSGTLHGPEVSLLSTTAERWETQSQLVAVALTLDLVRGDTFPF